MHWRVPGSIPGRSIFLINYSEGEIVNDFNIPTETIRTQLREGYNKAVAGAEEVIDGVKVSWGDMMRDTFDGQSISLLMKKVIV